MTVPTIGSYRRIYMAGVTEFFLAGVTLHAGVLQALLISFTFQVKIFAVPSAKYFIPPLIQQLHMV